MSSDYEEIDTRIVIETRQHRIHQYDVYLTGLIGDPKDFIELLHLLRTATQHDEINIYINSQGGQLRTGAAILHAIAGSQAKVTTIMDGSCASMAGIIALAGDDIIAMPMCQWMGHGFSAGYYGKAHEVGSKLESDKAMFETMARAYYANFLKKKEIDDLIKGKDIYFEYDEIKKRLERMIKEEAKCDA